MCSALRTFPNLFGCACRSAFLSAVYAALHTGVHSQVNYILRVTVRSVTITAAGRLSMPVSAYKHILLPLCTGCLASLSLADVPHSFIAAICKVPDFVPHIHFCAHTSFNFPSGLSSRILCNSSNPNRRTHDAEIYFTSVMSGRSLTLKQ